MCRTGSPHHSATTRGSSFYRYIRPFLSARETSWNNFFNRQTHKIIVCFLCLFPLSGLACGRHFLCGSSILEWFSVVVQYTKSYQRCELLYINLLPTSHFFFVFVCCTKCCYSNTKFRLSNVAIKIEVSYPLSLVWCFVKRVSLTSVN